MLYLVTSKPAKAPGRYLRKGKSSSEVIGDVANALISKQTVMELFNTGATAMRLYDAVRGGDLSLAVEPTEDGFLSAANAIDKKTISESHITHDSVIFNGMFSSKKQYDILLKFLPADDSDIIICGADDASKMFPSSRVRPGIYFQHQDKLIPSNDFSTTAFEILRVSIIDTFATLGAKEIKITDNTDITAEINASLSKEVLALAPSLNLNMKKSTKFSIYATLDGIQREINNEFIDKVSHDLQHAPELRKLAEHAAKNPGSLKTITKDIELNISFGLNINLLTAFQGAFTGGHERALSIEIYF